MNQLTTEECVKISKTYYKIGDSKVSFQSNEVVLGDEVHFSVGGHIAKQNYRIKSSENPVVIVEKSLHPEKN